VPGDTLILAGAGLWLAAIVMAVALCRAAAMSGAGPPELEGLDGLDGLDAAVYLVAGAGELELASGGAEPDRDHEHAAREAVGSRSTVEHALGTGLVAAAPMLAGGRAMGALVVSAGRARPSLTFAERRAVRELAADLAHRKYRKCGTQDRSRLPTNRK
jgi:hypothetical protein